MARSYKKNPGFQNPSMGNWKREVNRAFRHKSRYILNQNASHIDDNALDDIEDKLPEDLNEVSDVWLSPKDGQHFYMSEKESQSSDWIKPHKLTSK